MKVVRGEEGAGSRTYTAALERYFCSSVYSLSTTKCAEGDFLQPLHLHTEHECWICTNVGNCERRPGKIRLTRHIAKGRVQPK